MALGNATPSGLRVLLGCASLAIIFSGLKLASSLVAPLLLAVFIAAISAPLIYWMNRQRVPLWLAAILVILTIFAVVLGIGSVVFQSVIELTARQEFYIQRLSEIYAQLIAVMAWLGWEIALDNVFAVVEPSHLWTLGLATLTGVGRAFSNGFLILLVFIFIIAELNGIPRKIRLAFASETNNLDWLDQFTTEINRYITTKTLLSLLTGVFIAIYLWLLGVDFPILWGMLAFMLNFIPNIGSVIAALPPVLLALIQLGFGYALATIAGFVIVNMGVGTFLEPRLLGKRLGMSPLVVFLSLIWWGWLLGTIGMLLSVPITMTIKLAAESHPNQVWLATLLGNNPKDVEAEANESPEKNDTE